MRQKPLKFAISSAIALVWAALCTMLAVPWARASSIQLPSGYVLWVIVGIALLPGDLMCAMFFSNLFNAKMHAIATPCREPVSVLICARNEQNCIFQTIRQVVQQDYDGRIDLVRRHSHRNSARHTGTVVQAAVNPASDMQYAREGICAQCRAGRNTNALFYYRGCRYVVGQKGNLQNHAAYHLQRRGLRCRKSAG